MASKQNKTCTYILSVQSYRQDKQVLGKYKWMHTHFSAIQMVVFLKSHIDYKNIAQRKRRLCVKKCIIMWDSHKLYTKPTKPMMFVFICCLSFFLLLSFKSFNALSYVFTLCTALDLFIINLLLFIHHNATLSKIHWRINV